MTEGVCKQLDDFKIDMMSDEEADIIATTQVDIYTSKFKDNIYYFGYKFKDNCSSYDRTEFIKWLKSKTINDLTPEIESFIIKPLKNLYKNISIEDKIDAIISPKSNVSELVKIIKSILISIMPRDTVKSYLELVKNLPENVSFDWEQFNYDYEGEVDDYRYKQIYNYIEKELMPKIHSLDYFSIARNVKPKYRKYIQNYLMFNSEADRKLFNAIKKGNILIIDDISTSGSTLDEILKIINVLNNDCNIYIFTLIGK